jgi:hypothetical protein
MLCLSTVHPSLHYEKTSDFFVEFVTPAGIVTVTPARYPFWQVLPAPAFVVFLEHPTPYAGSTQYFVLLGRYSPATAVTLEQRIGASTEMYVLSVFSTVRYVARLIGCAPLLPFRREAGPIIDKHILYPLDSTMYRRVSSSRNASGMLRRR